MSGCAAPGPEPTIGPSNTALPTAAEPTPTETAAASPVLVPDGTATDNLPVFAATVEAVWASDQSISGRAYVDALTAVGFDKSAMQVTNDQSTVGNAAESIQFSVRWEGECLVGQIGPATGQPVSVVLPVTAEGTCLIGRTRPIDW